MSPDDQWDPQTVARIRTRIDELNRRWQATPVGEVFRLDWPAAGAQPG